MKILFDRTKGIGGSDVHQIFNLAPYGCARRLWYEKTNFPPDYPVQDNLNMARGRFYEPIVAKLYQKRTKRKLLTRVPPLQSPTLPFIVGNVDALTKDGHTPVEIKCPSFRNFKKIKNEGIPDYYILQLQHYINLTNAEFGSYAIFSAETAELLTFDVPRDPKLIEQIVEAEKEFWGKVLKLIEPKRLSIDDKRCTDCAFRTSCQELMNELPESGVIEIRNDLNGLVKDYFEAKSIAEDAEDYLESIKNKLKESLGNTQAAETPGARIYYRQTEAWRWDVKRLEVEHPELVKDFKVKQITRPLRIFNS